MSYTNGNSGNHAYISVQLRMRDVRVVASDAGYHPMRSKKNIYIKSLHARKTDLPERTLPDGRVKPNRERVRVHMISEYGESEIHFYHDLNNHRTSSSTTDPVLKKEMELWMVLARKRVEHLESLAYRNRQRDNGERRVRIELQRYTPGLPSPYPYPI
ncbi:MAG: hypothetical protein HYW22_02780 [Candidatus Aenigmarchaeota archaeon]|nr:hypothetical protein [Candidatus Aenigmarchaeota archaeon]